MPSSGRKVLKLVSLVTDTSATFQIITYPNDGSTPVGTLNFVGSGRNDLQLVGNYSGAVNALLEIEIVDETTPDAYQYRFDGGAWLGPVVIDDGVAQSIGNGLSTLFELGKDHTIGDTWEMQINIVTFTSAGPESIGDGLSITLGADPNTTTTGWTIGDKWQFFVQGYPTEPRFAFNGVFDVQRPAWEVAVQIGALSRALILKRGTDVVPKLEKQKPAVQMFNEGNIKRADGSASTASVKWINPADHANTIDVVYLNKDRNYTQDTATAALPALDEAVGNIIKKSVQMFGVTSPYQARRSAAYLLRAEQSNVKIITFESSIEAIAVEPGDVFYFTSGIIGWSSGGRIANVAGGFVVLDQALTFAADTLYRYLEKSAVDDTILAQDFTMAAGETDTLTFAPLHSPTTAAAAIGRTWILGTKFRAEQKFVCLTTTWINAGMDRRITALIYEESVYTDDSEDFPSAQFIPIPGGAPVDVTGIIISEACLHEVNPVSTLTVEWTAAAGAAAYQVLFQTFGADSFILAGTTTDVTLDFDVTFALGTPLVIAVRTLMADGQITPIADAPTAEWIIERREGGCEMIAFPEQVQNIILTDLLTTDANDFTLSWDAVTLDTDGDALTPTGYEVRIGEWIDGVTIFDANGLSVDVKMPNTSVRYHVRAYKTQGGEKFYSPEAAYVEDNNGAFLNGYPALSEAAYNLFYYAQGNAFPIVWNKSHITNDTIPHALIQGVVETTMEVLFTVFDQGASLATHLSLDPRATTALIDNGAALFATMEQWSPAGRINGDYLDWDLVVEYSDDPGFATFSSQSYKEKAAQNILFTARYLRLRFKSNSLDVAEIQKPARAVLERLVIGVANP